MPLRPLPWPPEYGASMQFEAGDAVDSAVAAEATVEANAAVERPRWTAADRDGDGSAGDWSAVVSSRPRRGPAEESARE